MGEAAVAIANRTFLQREVEAHADVVDAWVLPPEQLTVAQVDEARLDRQPVIDPGSDPDFRYEQEARPKGDKVVLNLNGGVSDPSVHSGPLAGTGDGT